MTNAFSSIVLFLLHFIGSSSLESFVTRHFLNLHTGMESNTSITEKLSQGRRLTAVGIEDKKAIDFETFTVSSYLVKNRTLLQIHPNPGKGEPREITAKKYVILELLPASLPEEYTGFDGVSNSINNNQQFPNFQIIKFSNHQIASLRSQALNWIRNRGFDCLKTDRDQRN